MCVNDSKSKQGVYSWWTRAECNPHVCPYDPHHPPPSGDTQLWGHVEAMVEQEGSEPLGDKAGQGCWAWLLPAHATSWKSGALPTPGLSSPRHPQT